MSPYRNNVKPQESEPTSWDKFLEKMQLAWLFIGDMAYAAKNPVITVLSWLIAIAVIGSIMCLLALLAQWVMTGLAGHPMGRFEHYVGAIVLYSILTSRPRGDRKI